MRIHVDTADADATQQDSFVASAVCIGLNIIYCQILFIGETALSQSVFPVTVVVAVVVGVVVVAAIIVVVVFVRRRSRRRSVTERQLISDGDFSRIFHARRVFSFLLFPNFLFVSAL